MAGKPGPKVELVCPVCGVTFYKPPSQAVGRYCCSRRCQGIKQRKYMFPSRPQRRAANSKNYRDNNKLLCTLKKKVKRYKISMFEIYQKWEEQNKSCAICKEPLDIEKISVDHDHSCCHIVGATQQSCGKCNRGLLCGRCNRGLGQFKDSIEFLKQGIEYLEKWKGNNMEIGEPTKKWTVNPVQEPIPQKEPATPVETPVPVEEPVYTGV